jgi:hypothetical protein
MSPLEPGSPKPVGQDPIPNVTNREEVNMNIDQLIESLQVSRKAIGTETVQTIDFDRLEEDLGQAIETLSSLREKQQLCDRLLSDFKSDIRRMVLAVSRVKGEAGSCGLAEKLISSPDLSFDDLLFLRERVREEFNQCLPAWPRSKVTAGSTSPQGGFSEFKTGADA